MAEIISMEERAEILRLHAGGMSKTEIAERTGHSRGSIIRVVKEFVPTKATETPEQKAERVRLLAQERDLLKDVNGEKSFRTYLGNLLRGQIEQLPPPPKHKPPKRVKAVHERHLLLHLSDWHYGEIVEAEGVMGLNAYDRATASRRVWRVVHALIDQANDWRASGHYRFPELTVSLNGDFLTGTIHGLERHTDAANIVRCTLDCARLLAQAIRDLSAAFPSVKCIGTVGNHGRLPDDKKVPSKDPTRSWDYLCYAVAAEMLKDCRNVSFDLPNSYLSMYDVAGARILQGHGNFIKQQLGIVGYGINRFVSRAGATLAAAGKPLGYALFGHWHAGNVAEIAGIQTFINPSLIGTQEYGLLERGTVNRPAQHCYVFDAQLGCTMMLNLFGDGPGYDGTYEVN